MTNAKVVNMMQRMSRRTCTLSKILPFVLLCLYWHTAARDFVKILHPNGAETLQQSNTYHIVYEDDIDDYVTIELFKSDSFFCYIAPGNPSTSPFIWNIPEDFPLSDAYTIVIRSTKDSSVCDSSDAVFSIIPCFTVTSFPHTETFDQFDLGTKLHNSWEQLKYDSFDWTVHQGKTDQQGNTGPDGDHTSGSGKYLYTEASDHEEKEAFVRSPQFDISVLPNPELIFWYHMFSKNNTMGHLRLDISVDGKLKEEVIHLSNNQGKQWHAQSISLVPHTGEKVQFIFRSKIGSEENSDICIDDFIINNVPEFESEPVTEAKVGEEYTYAIRVKDCDASSLEIKPESIPSWLTLHDKGDGTALLHGTPGQEHSGNTDIVIAASDMLILKPIEQTFSLDVVPIVPIKTKKKSAEPQNCSWFMTPNPVRGSSHVTFHYTFASSIRSATITVFDPVGNRIYTDQLSGLRGKKIWNLTSSCWSGKRISPNSYLVALTMTDIHGKVFHSEKILGVQ